LWFTVTVAVLFDTVTIGTGPLGLRVAATDLGVVPLEVLEATFLVTLIRFI